MAKPKLKVQLIKNNAKGNNARLDTTETTLQKVEDTTNERENSTENEQIKEHTANKYEVIKSRAAGDKKKISKCIILLINLAISDLVVGIDIILAKLLFFITMKIKNRALLYTLAFFRSCLLPTSLTMSITNLLILAILRFYAVTQPLKYRTITRKFLVKICILQWVLITLAIIFHFAFSYRLNGNNSVSSNSRIVYYLITPVLVILAITAFIFTYFSTFNAIRARMTTQESNNMNLNKRREKTFQVAFYTVIAFVVCWLPSSGFRIYERVTENTYPKAGLFLSYFVFLNSVGNPIIYFTIFRKQP